MSMYNLDLLSNDDIPEDGEEREDGGKGGCAVNDEKRDMVDLEAIREISHAGSPIICMRYNYDFVSSVDELGRELVDVAFYSTGLGKEEIADHCDIVRHLRGIWRVMLLTEWSARRLEIRAEDKDASLGWI